MVKEILRLWRGIDTQWTIFDTWQSQNDGGKLSSNPTPERETNVVSVGLPIGWHSCRIVDSDAFCWAEQFSAMKEGIWLSNCSSRRAVLLAVCQWNERRKGNRGSMGSGRL